MKLDHRKYTVIAVLAALILLLMAGSVMAQPVITTFKPNVDTQIVGENATWTVTSPNGVNFAFYVFKRADGDVPEKRVHTQWYSANNSVTYKFLESGDYYARVFAEDADGKLTIVDSPAALDVVVTGDASLILTKLEFMHTPPIWDPPDKIDTIPVGDDLMYAVKPDGGEEDFTYAYYIYFKGDGDADFKRVHLQWYAPGNPDPEYQGEPYEHNFFQYNAKEPGEYYAQAFVMDNTGKIVNEKSGITKAEGASVALGITEVTDAVDNGIITWNVAATGEGDLEYAFYVQKHEEGDDWKRVHLQWYSDVPTCTYRPLESGLYNVRVFLLEADTGKTVNGYYGEVDFTDGEALAVQVGLWDGEEYIKEEPFGDVGELKTWKATVSGGAGNCEYAFYVYEGDNRVHMQWYSGSDTVDYTPKDADAYYWVRVFVIDDAGTLLVKDSDPIKFGGETVEPFRINKVRFAEGVKAEVNTIDYYLNPAGEDTEEVTYDGFSLTDFRLPWVWEVELPEKYEGQSEDNKISYCYYLYYKEKEEDTEKRIDLQWYEEGENTYTYKIKDAGFYRIRAFAMDEHGHIANDYSSWTETKLYHFNYTFDDPGIDGLVEDSVHGWIWDKGYFYDRHKIVQEFEDFSCYDGTGKTHSIASFPLHDELTHRGYGNQSSSVRAAVYFGEDGSRVYLDGKNELNVSRWLSTERFEKVKFAVLTNGLSLPGEINKNTEYTVTNFNDTDNSFTLEDDNSNQVTFTAVSGGVYDMSLVGMERGDKRTNYKTETDNGDNGNGYLVLATDNVDHPLTWKCSKDGAVYRFAGIRPTISGGNLYPRREFWRYMITPNLPYGEVYFRNIHSTDEPTEEGTPVQEARFNFEFMHHSTGKGGDPYDQRVGISISKNGTIRILDTKAGRGIFDDADANFYMPVLAGKTAYDCGFDNNKWNKLRIQGLASGKMQFFLNDHLVYETPLGYYHITNAEKGTITLEVVQAAVAASEGEWNDNQIGNAVVELDNYSFGIMKYEYMEADPGKWTYN